MRNSFVLSDSLKDQQKVYSDNVKAIISPQSS